jgi:hypothetical protein
VESLLSPTDRAYAYGWRRRSLVALVALWTVGLAACGGSDSSGNDSTTGDTAPTITAQPQSQSVTVGSTATFSVVAAGTAPLSYQWLENGTAIVGATSSSFTTPATVSGDSGSTFSVQVSNTAGSMVSNSATLTVTAASVAPTITTQPESQSVTVGAAAAFTVVASGTAPLSYQWSKNGTAIAGATTVNYTTPATVSGDNGSTFSVQVSNAAGSKTSNTATLTVTAAAAAPTITTQPQSQSVTVGATANFTVVATGTAPLSYQWSKNGTAIAGATSASYTTPATVSGDSGSTFSVQVSNTAGSKTSNTGTLTVNPAPVPPTITTQPQSQTVTVGSTVTFSVVATGTAPLSYQWSKNTTAISGATGSSYTTPATVSGDNGTTFTVAVTNSAGSQTSSPATLTVNSSSGVTVALSPPRAAVTTGVGQTFTPTVTGTSNTAVTWSVDGVAGGNATVGTISTSGAYAPPASAGTHTVTATSVASPGTSASSTVAVTDLTGILTQRFDNARDGQNLQEYALTPAVLSTPGAFGKLFTCSVDGSVYAEPLYVANLSIAGGTHNVVFVATEHDSVYAFDADASPCVQYWKTSFLSSGVTTVPPGDTGDGGSGADLPGELGISGTPVIDVGNSTLYVVVNTKETGSTYYNRIHALNIATGTEQANSPQVILPTYSDSSVNFGLNQMQRPGLLYVSSTNTVYVPFGSHGDVTPYYGFMIAFNPTSLQPTAQYNTTPSNEGGAIWMAGAGPAADSSGYIYVSTANGPFDASNTLPPTSGNDDFGDSVVKLDTSNSLAIKDFFTPSDQSILQSDDYDLGSGGVVVLPDAVGTTAHPHLMIAGDKEAKLFLIDRDNMGRYNSGANSNLETVVVNNQGPGITNGIFTTASLWGSTVYIGAIGDTVKAYPISNGLLTTTPASQSADVYNFPGANTVISASGSSNGVLWALDTDNAGQTSDTGTNGPAVLRAYDASNLANRLWSSDTQSTDAGVNAVKFVVPTVANGKVYVVGQKAMTVYGLLP